MRMPHLLAAVLLLSSPVTLSAQTAADTVHAKIAKDTLTAIRKRSTSPTIRRQVDYLLRHEDSLVKASVTPPPGPVAVRVEIHGSAASLAAGTTMQLIADARDAAGNPVTTAPVWSAGPLAVGTVSTTGLLTGVSAGTVTVTVKVQTVTSSRQFTVTGSPGPPDTTTTNPTGTIAALPINAEVSDAIPATTSSVRVQAGQNLQSALDAAACNSTLLLDAGASWVGNYVLPASKGPNCWVVVRTGLMVRPTGRMTPTKAASINLARVSSPSYEPTFATRVGTSGIVLADLDIGVTSAATLMNMSIRLQDNATRIIITGNYIHGHALLDSRRGVLLNGRDIAFTKNWVSDFHSNNGDNQALIGYDFTARIRIEDNYLTASHEVIMFGGADPTDSTRGPSDIIIRGNHITRPLAWKGVWQVKNLVESKFVRRLLIEGNVVENVWADAQTGFAFVMKSENQNGTAPWTTSSDITIRYNLIQCVASGFNFSGKGSNGTPNITAARFTVYQNLIRNVNTGACTGDGIGMQLLSQMTDVNVTFTSIKNATNSNQLLSFDGAPSPGFIFTDVKAYHGTYGVKGSNQSDGLTTLNAYAPGAVFTRNAVIGGGDCSQYPSGNVCPATEPASPGANEAAILARVANVVVSDPAMMAPRVARPSELRYKWHATPPEEREGSLQWLKSKHRKPDPGITR